MDMVVVSVSMQVLSTTDQEVGVVPKLAQSQLLSPTYPLPTQNIQNTFTHYNGT